MTADIIGKMILWDIACNCHKNSPFIDYKDIVRYKRTISFAMQKIAYNMILEGQYYG